MSQKNNRKSMFPAIVAASVIVLLAMFMLPGCSGSGDDPTSDRTAELVLAADGGASPIRVSIETSPGYSLDERAQQSGDGFTVMMKNKTLLVGQMLNDVGFGHIKDQAEANGSIHELDVAGCHGHYGYMKNENGDQKLVVMLELPAQNSFCVMTAVNDTTDAEAQAAVNKMQFTVA